MVHGLEGVCVPGLGGWVVHVPGGRCMVWGGGWLVHGLGGGGIPAFTEADPSPLNRITDACKNTLPQLRWAR